MVAIMPLPESREFADQQYRDALSATEHCKGCTDIIASEQIRYWRQAALAGHLPSMTMYASGNAFRNRNSLAQLQDLEVYRHEAEALARRAALAATTKRCWHWSAAYALQQDMFASSSAARPPEPIRSRNWPCCCSRRSAAWCRTGNTSAADVRAQSTLTGRCHRRGTRTRRTGAGTAPSNYSARDAQFLGAPPLPAQPSANLPTCRSISTGASASRCQRLRPRCPCPRFRPACPGCHIRFWAYP